MLFACLESHHFMFYPDVVRERFAKTLRMEDVTFRPNTMFITKGSLEHAGGK